MAPSRDHEPESQPETALLEALPLKQTLGAVHVESTGYQQDQRRCGRHFQLLQ